MPLTGKGNEIMSNMKQEYGPSKGEQVFYASKNAGKITGVDFERPSGVVEAPKSIFGVCNPQPTE